MKILFVILIAGLSIFSSSSFSAPYAAIVINAKNGEVLHCEECDANSKNITYYLRSVFTSFAGVTNYHARAVYRCQCIY